jgi:hypothetical protein
MPEQLAAETLAKVEMLAGEIVGVKIKHFLRNNL